MCSAMPSPNWVRKHAWHHPFFEILQRTKIHLDTSRRSGPEPAMDDRKLFLLFNNCGCPVGSELM